MSRTNPLAAEDRAVDSLDVQAELAAKKSGKRVTWAALGKQPYTAEFIAAHLAAGRPLVTLGLDPRLDVVRKAKELVARARIAKRKADAKGDPLVTL
jgi:hypothetical protein